MSNKIFVYNTVYRFGKMVNFASCIGSISVLEYASLYSLFNATNGTNWRWSPIDIEWKFPSSLRAPCTDGWKGINCTAYNTSSNTVSTPDCSIEVVSLLAHNLVGTIPSEIGNLKNVVKLDFTANKLTGTLPTDLSLLRSLKSIYSSNNSFAGYLPDWSQLNNLEEVYLSGNKFSGSISTSIGMLSRLTDIYLEDNLLTGTIPTEMGLLTKLLNVNFHRNQLTGPLPTEIGLCSKLQNLYLETNSLTGNLPHYWSHLSLLGSVYVAENSLTGTIPTAWNNMTELAVLQLQFNLLTGTLPSSFGELTNMQPFTVENNYLTGTIPPEYANMARGSQFTMSVNYLTGSVPSSLGSMEYLVGIVANNNYLTGTIPTEFANSRVLNQIILSNNQLTGTIPDTILQASLLEMLNVSSNRLKGRIDVVFENAIENSVINTLDFSNNALTGSLPSNFNNVGRLLILSLGNNCFQGVLPESICEVDRLVALVLDGLTSNKQCASRIPSVLSPLFLGVFPKHLLSGTIPSCYLRMPNLTSLHLSGNGLTGTLSELPESSAMEDLNLASNFLAGTLPSTWQDFGKFMRLDVSSNKLSGTLSEAFILYRNATDTDISLNRLSGNIPSIFRSAENINILNGNLFQCSTNTIPTNDPDSSQYVCGSSDLNIALIFWLVVAAVVSGCFYYLLVIKGKMKIAVGSIRDWWRQYAQLDTETPLQHTTLFLTVIQRACGTGLCLSVFYLVVCMVIYILLKTIPELAELYSTHSYQYMWITTSAYLHGSVPAGLIMAFLFITEQVICHYLIDGGPRTVSVSSDQKSVNLFRSDSNNTQSTAGNGWRDRIRVHCVIFALQLVNTVVVVAVNSAYVYGILQGLTPAALLATQLGLSAFKLSWNAVGVPGFTSKLSLLSPVQSGLNVTFMTIFNFIIGPILASFVTDRDCLHDAFFGQDPISSTYLEPTFAVFCLKENSPTACTRSRLLFETTVSTTITPPWLYTYQCSSALLTNYIPVLFYAFAISGMSIPLAYLILSKTPVSLLNRYLPQCFLNWALEDRILPTELSHLSIISLQDALRDDANKQNDVNSSNVLFKGSHILVKLSLNFSVLMTFGLASPLLGCAVAVDIISVAVLWKWLIQKYLSVNMHDRNTSSFEKKNGITVTMSHSPLTDNLVAKDDKSCPSSSFDHSSSLSFATPTPRTTHDAIYSNLEKATFGSFSTLLGSMYIVIIMSSLFWSLTIFDYLADVYGNLAGGIGIVVVAVGLPAACLLIDVMKTAPVAYDRYFRSKRDRSCSEAVRESEIQLRTSTMCASDVRGTGAVGTVKLNSDFM